jgi:uncharacterized protein YjiS (DUF1127 family)
MLRNDPRTAPMGPTAAWWLSCADPKRGWAGAVIATVTLWMERSRNRRALAALDDYRLRDIGVSRFDAEQECAKPFWIP